MPTTKDSWTRGVGKFWFLNMRNAVLSLVIFLAILQTTESLKTCTNKNGDRTITCNHGDCSSDGSCLCQPCWKGAYCDISVNAYEPTFDQLEQDITTNVIVHDGEEIHQVRATDRDLETTCNGHLPCDCANISYSIQSGNEDAKFMIDPDTGIISLANGAIQLDEASYRLEIAAKNPNNEYGDVSKEVSSVVSVNIRLPGKKELYSVHGKHSRHKRFAPSVAIPQNNSFALELLGGPITDVEQGMVISFELYLHFALGTTDVLVEIFTPVNQTEIFSLCVPAMTVIGSNIQFTNNTPIIDKSEMTGVYNRAVFDLGNVTNTGVLSNNYQDSIIKIEFKVTMVDPALDPAVNGQIFWISAGVEYNVDTNLWVGQHSFVAKPVSSFTEIPSEFNLTGPSEISVDTAVRFDLKLKLPVLGNQVQVDVFPPLNVTSVMTVCNIKLIGHGSNFGCVNTTGMLSSLTESEIDSGYSRGHLDIGMVTNTQVRTGSYDNTEDYFHVQFSMITYNDSALIGRTVHIGAAVLVGPNYIWTVRKQIQIIAKQPYLQAQTVSSSLKGGKLIVRPDEPAITYLHLLIPTAGECNIEVKLILPAATLSEFDICKVDVIKTGYHIPCLLVKSKFYQNAQGEAILNLGNVKVFEAGNTADNEIVLELAVRSRLSTPKAIYTINVEVITTSTTTVPTPLTYQIDVSNDIIVVNDTYKPICSIEDTYNKQALFQGESAKVSLNITFPTAASINNLEIESFVPEANGIYMFSLCKAEIAWVGRNLPCVDKTKADEAMHFLPMSTNQALNFKVNITFESLCITDVYTGEFDNTITIDLIFKLEGTIPNNKTWITAGLTILSKLWVGQVAFQEKTNAVADVVPDGSQRVDVIDIKQVTAVPLSYIKAYNISIKIPPISSANVVVNLLSNSPNLTICSARFIEKGSNIGCLSNETTSVRATNSIFKESFNINFGPITNIGTTGIHQSPLFDKSTVVLQAYVVMKNTSTASLSVSVTLGTQPPIVNVFNIEGTTDTSEFNLTNILQNESIFVARIVRNNATTLAKGETRRVVVQFYVGPQTFQKMKFQTRVDKIGMARICDYNIIYGGVNLVCLDRLGHSAENISKEEWILEANICSWPIELDDPKSNKVQIEAIVAVPSNSTISVNDVFNVITDIYINDSPMKTLQIPLTIIDTFTEEFNNWVTENTTKSCILLSGTPPTSAGIGEVFDMTVKLAIPVNSTSLVKFKVSLPVTESAHMTIQDIRYNGSDKDIACLNNLEPNFTSTNNTSQNDIGELDFGILTNTGIRSRIFQFDFYYSRIELIVTLQMTDAKENIDQSDQNISMELKMGSFVVPLIHTIKVNRNANDAPKLYFEAGFNDTGRPLNNYFLTINAIMRLENDSAAELRPALAIFYLSPWVQYDGRFTTNKIGPPPNATFNNQTGRLEFKFEQFFLTDDVEFSFSVSRKTAPYTKSLVNSTTPYEAGGFITHHTVSSYTAGHFFSSPMKSFTFTVQNPPAIDSCGGKLTINDCQISVPLESIYENGVFQAFIGSGMYAAKRYLQVYFGNKVKVEKISIHTEPSSTASVDVFKMAYSDDGISWVSGPRIPVDNLFNVSISRPLESRYLRLYVLEHMGNDDNLLAFKIDFFGCELSNEVTDVCANAPIVTNPYGWYYRGFLEVHSKVYVCNADPKRDLKTFCYYSEDGISWYPLDTRLGNVNIYDNEQGRFYGISNDKVSYMTSDDGLFWKFINPAIVIDLLNTCDTVKCTKALTLPWKNGAILSTDIESSIYKMTNWGASYNGTFKFDGTNWVHVADWSTCGH